MSSGGGGGGSTQNTVVNQLSPEVAAATQENYQFAKDIANRPYQPYTGPTVAGFNATQQLGQNMGANAALTNAGGGTLNSALDTANRAGQTATTGFQSYLDQVMPQYSSNVIKPALDALETQRQQALAGNASDATAARAFGGDRQGVVEANTNALFGNQAAQLQANLSKEGYETALGQFNADQNRGLQTSGLLAQLAGQERNNAFGNASALEGIGAEQQQQQQAHLDDVYNRFLEARDYPLQQLAIRQSALSSQPYATSQSSTTTGAKGSRAGGILGGALSGASLGSNFGPWGSAIGGIGGGLLGGFF